MKDFSIQNLKIKVVFDIDILQTTIHKKIRRFNHLLFRSIRPHLPDGSCVCYFICQFSRLKIAFGIVNWKCYGIFVFDLNKTPDLYPFRHVRSISEVHLNWTETKLIFHTFYCILCRSEVMSVSNLFLLWFVFGTSYYHSFLT